MPLVALIPAAIGIGSAVISAHGAQSAANTQANAANQAAATQLQMYNQTRTDLMPYMTTGSAALSQLANLWGIGPGGSGTPNAAAATSALTQFPGYQFGLNQGVQALDRSAASRGLALSGAQLQATQQFGNNYAMQQAWNPYVSQLNSLSSLGEDAGARVGNAGVTTGQGVASSQLAAGQATAAGQVGVTNSINQGLGGLGNLISSYGNNAAASAGSQLAASGNYYSGSYAGGEVPF
jgi:hypothetical protein